MELAYLAGKGYGRHRSDLLKKVEGIAGVANIPEIQAQPELINKILHTDYIDNAGIDEFENIRIILRLQSLRQISLLQRLNDTNLDSRQIYFVNQIVEYIVHNGMMKDLSVLQESPFTDKGSVAEIFTDMTVWMGIRKVIDQINTNAAA